MGRARDSIDAVDFGNEQQEKFDYVLTPILASYIFPMIMPGVMLFMLVGAYAMVSDMFTSMLGFSVSVKMLLIVAGVLTTFNIIVKDIVRRSTKLMLHIDYIVYKRGIFFTSINKVYISDIKNVRVFRSFWDRVFGTGTLAIATAGTDGYEIIAKGFQHPEAIMRYIAVHRKEGE